MKHIGRFGFHFESLWKSMDKYDKKVNILSIEISRWYFYLVVLNFEFEIDWCL